MIARRDGISYRLDLTPQLVRRTLTKMGVDPTDSRISYHRIERQMASTLVHELSGSDWFDERMRRICEDVCLERGVPPYDVGRPNRDAR